MSRKPALDDSDAMQATIEQWRQAAANLLKKGLIYDTGQTRNGEPVYAAVPPPEKRH